MSHIVKDLAGSAASVQSRCVFSKQITEDELNPPIVTSLNGFTMYTEAGEWTEEIVVKLSQVSHVSQENVRCVMGYIVDLTVILDDIFRTAPGNVSSNDVQLAMERHVNSGRRDRIHRDIQSFVTETFAIRFTVPQRDLVLEKIIDLIRQYCVPPSMGG